MQDVRSSIPHRSFFAGSVAIISQFSGSLTVAGDGGGDGHGAHRQANAHGAEPEAPLDSPRAFPEVVQKGPKARNVQIS